MCNYQMQIRKTARIYDEAMHTAELEGIEVLHSGMQGSRLHQIINNPVDSGIDEV